MTTITYQYNHNTGTATRELNSMTKHQVEPYVFETDMVWVAYEEDDGTVLFFECEDTTTVSPESDPDMFEYLLEMMNEYRWNL